MLKKILFPESTQFKSVIKRVAFFGVLLFITFILSNEIISWMNFNCTFSYAPIDPRDKVFVQAIVVALIQLLALGQFAGLFHGLLRYFRVPDFIRTAFTLAAISITLLFLTYIPNIHDYIPISRRLIFADLIFSIFIVCGIRGVFRMLWEYGSEENAKTAKVKRVAIFGAGDAGSSLAATLLAKPNMHKKPVVFFDDNPAKKGFSISGVPVIGPLEKVAFYREFYKLDELILAIPAAKITRVREIRKIAIDAGLSVVLVPGIEELSRGNVSVSSLRKFELQDLLDRPPLDLNDSAISKMIIGKTVLVTGAGGSIGGEICRQVARCAPARLLLVDQCEVLLYQIEQNLISLGFRDTIEPIIADIVDIPRMECIFTKYKPDIIFHAAAHKHVPMMERQPGEAIKNNSLGSEGLFEIASKFNASTFVMISTDKAINPTNAMGASKRLAEIMLQSFAQKPGNKTRFMAVRFGNVLGSSGSVIPMFKKQIQEGGPLTVTHQDIKRYFMTIPEACGLVLQTGTIGKNGCIYVLDMGQSVKIIDVARHLIELSGLRPDIDIAIKITGLRPGEKLFEELKSTGENYEPSGHPRISRFKCEPMPLEKLEDLKDFLKKLSQCSERNEIKFGIQSVVPEYKPYLD